MRVVIDTNIFVSSLSKRSEFHWFILAMKAGHFQVAVSHEMLLEYEEILKVKYAASVAGMFLRFLGESSFVDYVDIYYQWRLLPDPDDDKFVDAYISAGADYLVTEDGDYKKLKDLEFPKVNVIRLAEFKEILENKN